MRSVLGNIMLNMNSTTNTCFKEPVHRFAVASAVSPVRRELSPAVRSRRSLVDNRNTIKEIVGTEINNEISLFWWK